jgi:hypothetical protein
VANGQDVFYRLMSRKINVLELFRQTNLQGVGAEPEFFMWLIWFSLE